MKISVKMRTAAVTLATVALCITSTLATRGVDYSTPQSVATHQCWKNNGMNFAIPRAYKSYGAFDSNAIANVNNAHAAGIPYVDIYMFPCRGKSASAQVSELVSAMGSTSYG